MADPDDDPLADVVASLRGIEERLRDAAYEALRARVEDGDEAAAATERRLLQARRAVERALRALGGEPGD